VRSRRHRRAALPETRTPPRTTTSLSQKLSTKAVSTVSVLSSRLVNKWIFSAFAPSISASFALMPRKESLFSTLRKTVVAFRFTRMYLRVPGGRCGRCVVVPCMCRGGDGVDGSVLKRPALASAAEQRVQVVCWTRRSTSEATPLLLIVGHVFERPNERFAGVMWLPVGVTTPF